MLTKSDKEYVHKVVSDVESRLSKKFVSIDHFNKTMDAVGERFDSLENGQAEITTVLQDIVARLQKIEENTSELRFIGKDHKKRLVRVEHHLRLPAVVY